jgi:hypothetical protein
MSDLGGTVSADDWVKGVGWSLLSSIIGAASKLAIRKSWLIEHQHESSSEVPTAEDPSVPSDASSDFLLMETPQGEVLKTPLSDGLETTRDSLRLRRHSPESSPLNVEAYSMVNDDDDDDDDDGVSGIEEDDDSSDNDRRSLFESSSPSSKRGGGRRRHLQLNPPNDEDHPQKSMWLAYFLRSMGMLGMTVFNPLSTVIAMNYASPSILAPFSGLTLVWIILLSKPLLGEKTTPAQVLACSFILVGEVVVAAFGDHTNDDGVTVEDVVRVCSLKEVSGKRRRSGFIHSFIHAVSSSSFSIRTHRQKQSYLQPPFLIYCVGLFLWMVILTRWMLLPTVSPTLQRFSWGVWGGSITGLQNFLKDALTVLKATSSTAPHIGPIPVPPLLFFVLFAGAILAAFSGLCVLTLCMKRYDVTYSASMFVGSFVVSASIMSAVHYNTFSHLHSLQDFVLYPAGLVFLIIGVVMLAQEEHDMDSPREVTMTPREEIHVTDISVNDPLQPPEEIKV